MSEVLEMIAQEVRSCTKCRLHKRTKNGVPGEGRPDAEILFVGEGPGSYEDAQGRPFVGAAGKLLSEMLQGIGMTRDDVFITTKCFNDDHGYETAKQAFKSSLDRLELDFVDLYLIHWPVPKHDRYLETWQAFMELQQEGVVRSIGVSNFQPTHLRRLIDETGVTPVVNQVELHPRFQQAGLRREHEDRGIVTEAWSPLAQGQVLDDPVIGEIADEHGKSAGQVVLRWHVQLGNVVFPKSVTPERIEENFDVFDFHLTGDEMDAIEQLDDGERIGPDPDTFVRP